MKISVRRSADNRIGIIEIRASEVSYRALLRCFKRIPGVAVYGVAHDPLNDNTKATIRFKDIVLSLETPFSDYIISCSSHTDVFDEFVELLRSCPVSWWGTISERQGVAPSRSVHEAARPAPSLVPVLRVPVPSVAREQASAKRSRSSAKSPARPSCTELPAPAADCGRCGAGKAAPRAAHPISARLSDVFLRSRRLQSNRRALRNSRAPAFTKRWRS